MHNKKQYGWEYIDNQSAFRLDNPEKTSYLYFPLANEAGMMSCITPLLNGDLKTGQNCFMLLPVSQEDLHNTKSARNFWVVVNHHEVWSAAGNSSKQTALRFDENSNEYVTMEAGFLWHKVIRENRLLGLTSEITTYVPANNDMVELMKVKITNTGDKRIKISPIAAIPVYGRSADNLRDHRHVTSLLHRIHTTQNGVVVKPALSFDERGHKVNKTAYGIFGAEGDGNKPVCFYPLLEDFVGEGGCLEWPEIVVRNIYNGCKAGENFEGYEAMGGMRFEDKELEAGDSETYIIAAAIDVDGSFADCIIDRYLSERSFESYLNQNKEFWEKKLSKVSFVKGNQDFNHWIKWVSLQPILRRIYGCSFLPHHDYGRGGRGWRDLWQDCLALLLTDPEDVKNLLLNNFAGVRMDGSNATIIGSKPGEFIADRNNITRVWMDHGAWPFLTTKLYMDQTGDIEFLLEKQTYFKDMQIYRSREKDWMWKPEQGCYQRDREGNAYEGTILEHLLVQHLTPFFNVGKHNIIRLEGADWNDAFDMAEQNGESVAFSALYGSNMSDLCGLLRSLKQKNRVYEVELALEIVLLLDTMNDSINYESVDSKHELLEKYYDACKHKISGKKVKVCVDELIKDLERKADFITEVIRKQEWICNKSGFAWYNGYYDNSGRRVEGEYDHGVRMTLTGQVFPIMGNIAGHEQIMKIMMSANHYLKENRVGGYRLNTDFGEVKLDLGRCFGFAFGHKENGAMFSHMAVMFAYALYKRGFSREGFNVLDGIYKHCSDFNNSRIYPGIPEYTNERGRGMYHYLTGSASWMMLTVITQMFGIRGELGDLVLEPKLVARQFDEDGEAGVAIWFAGRKLRIIYKNKDKLDAGEYAIKSISGDKQLIYHTVNNGIVVIKREAVRGLSPDIEHNIEVELEKKCC